MRIYAVEGCHAEPRNGEASLGQSQRFLAPRAKPGALGMTKWLFPDFEEIQILGPSVVTESL